MTQHPRQGVINRWKRCTFWWLWESTQEPKQDRQCKDNPTDTLQENFGTVKQTYPNIFYVWETVTW